MKKQSKKSQKNANRKKKAQKNKDKKPFNHVDDFINESDSNEDEEGFWFPRR